jgi:diadenosine tetraphosphate (Ap4A) HIT family hydrolase
VTNFILHPSLAADTAFVSDWGLSRVLLMNDARYSWLILVPRRAGISELFQLAAAERAMLSEEIACAAQRLKYLAACAKINVGALGNLVPQLHVHVVARSPGDPAWPAPVWGHSPAVPYERTARDAMISQLVKTF